MHRQICEYTAPNWFENPRPAPLVPIFRLRSSIHDRKKPKNSQKQYLISTRAFKHKFITWSPDEGADTPTVHPDSPKPSTPSWVDYNILKRGPEKDTTYNVNKRTALRQRIRELINLLQSLIEQVLSIVKLGLRPVLEPTSHPFDIPLTSSAEAPSNYTQLTPSASSTGTNEPLPLLPFPTSTALGRFPLTQPPLSMPNIPLPVPLYMHAQHIAACTDRAEDELVLHHADQWVPPSIGGPVDRVRHAVMWFLYEMERDEDRNREREGYDTEWSVR